MQLEERRVLVVGASSGIGRDIAESLAGHGARVAFAARRGELVEDAARKVGNGAIGLACDVRDEASCGSVVGDTVTAFGGLDAVIYAAAVGPLVGLQEASRAVWQEALDINLVGAALTTAAALPHLEASGGGRAMYLSSVSGGESAPWPGLGVYAVTKAALERMVDCWRIEHPDVRFTSLVLGPIGGHNGAPGSFGASWDPDKVGGFIDSWTALGLLKSSVVDAHDLCEQVVAILNGSGSFSRVVLEP
jgi:NAD(P)-dependent dehydrogenase (short-subunit alcohol dehydrogenase family)